MKRLVRLMTFAACIAVLGATACNRDAGPPPPLALEKIPAEMQKAFKNALPEAGEAVRRISAALERKDIVGAYEEVEALSALPGATAEQRTFAARALLTLTGLLKSAQAQGDENASAALQLHKIAK